MRRDLAVAVGFPGGLSLDAPGLSGWSSRRTFLVSTGVVAAVVALALSHRGDIQAGVRSLATAHPAWLMLAVSGTAGLWLAGSISQLGAMPVRPPLRRLFAVQVAASFANHVLPGGVGGMTVNVRFLRRLGLSRPEAVGSVGLNSAVTGITHALLLFGALLLPPVARTVDFPSVPHLLRPSPGLALAVAVAIILAGGAARRRRRAAGCGTPAGRLTHLLGGQAELRASASRLTEVVRNPIRVAQLWGGSAGAAVIHGLMLAAVLRSLTPTVPLLAVVAVYLAMSAASALVPAPGAVGPLDVMLAGGLVSIQVPPATAVAAVIGYRAVTVWVPLLPSAWVFARLLRAGHI